MKLRLSVDCFDFNSDEVEFQTQRNQSASADHHQPPSLSTNVDNRIKEEEEEEEEEDDEASLTCCCHRFPEEPECPKQMLRRYRQSNTRIVHEAIAVIGILSFMSLVDLTSSTPLFYCHRLDATPRRLYATKTSYDDVRSLHEDNFQIVTSSQPSSDDTDDSTCDGNDDDDRARTEDDQKSLSCGAVRSVVELERIRNETTGNAINGLLDCRHSSTVNAEKKDECQPISFYILARHGTRFNKLSNMNGMAEKLEKIRTLIESHASKGTMCDEDLNWLRGWKPRHTAEDDSKLSSSGWNEILQIGQRYGDLFPSVLRRNYAPYLYEFRYTNYTGKGDRTRQSARAFAQGLWGSYENVEMTENPRPDWLLQFYEHCQKYLRIVGGHPVEDYEKFKTGPEMAQVIRDINTRLGLQENAIGFPEVYLIFENCRLEHGLYRDSPWCAVLTPSMLEVIEYHQDVKYYWEDGYGHRISYEPACTLIDDILRHLEDDTKLGRFRFAHSGTLDALYTRIGLFEDDEPLRANNYAHHRSHRQWTTSRFTPMAANIAFVKFRCLDRPLLRVKTIVNEDFRHPVTIPGCSSSLCPLETIRSLWRPIADDCDINRICEQTISTTASEIPPKNKEEEEEETISEKTSSVDASNRDILPLR